MLTSQILIVMISFEHCKDGVTQVIVTSSDHSQEIQDSALAHGAVAYVSKSEDPEIVEQLLEWIVGLSEITTHIN